MGGLLSNISKSMPNMSDVKSYFDPTAPPQGFSNTRAHGAVAAASGLQFGRSVKGLTNVKNAKSGAATVLNLSSDFDRFKRHLPGSKFKMPKNKKEGYKHNYAKEKTIFNKIKNQAKGLVMLTTLESNIKNNKHNLEKKANNIIPSKNLSAIVPLSGGSRKKSKKSLS